MRVLLKKRFGNVLVACDIFNTKQSAAGGYLCSLIRTDQAHAVIRAQTAILPDDVTTHADFKCHVAETQTRQNTQPHAVARRRSLHHLIKEVCVV